MDGVFGALGEVILSRHFLQPIHSFVVAGVMLLYMLMTFVVYASEGTWYATLLALAISLPVVFFCLLIYFFSTPKLTFFYLQLIWNRVYPFLRWSQGPIAAAYYIGIAIGLFIVFFALYFIHNARNSFFKERSARMNPELEHSPVDEKQPGDKTEVESV